MPENTKPGILRNLRIKRVSLVEAGANLDPLTLDGAHIMLYKSKDGMKKDGPNVGDVHVDGAYDDRDDYEKATLDAASRNSLPDSAFAAVWTDAQGKKRRKLPIHDAGHLEAARGRVDGADIPADVKAKARAKIESASNKHKEKPVAKTFWKSLLDAIREPDADKRVMAVGELEKAFPDNLKDKEDAKEGDEPVHKSGDAMCKCADCMAKRQVGKSAAELAAAADKAAIEKKFVDLEKANKDLAAQLVIEKSVRLDGEMREILKSFKATPLKLTGEDNDIAKFRKMKESDPAMFDRMIEVLKAQDAQMAMSGAFNSLGTSRTGTGSSYDQLVAKANAIVEKGAAGMTFEKAFEQVSLQNPKLVEQYRNEQQ